MENKIKSNNEIYILLKSVNIKFKRWLNKLSNRLQCEHLLYKDIHCYHSGLFMYKECCNCGKKKYW